MGCRPQIVLLYFLRYSVNALGSTCTHSMSHTICRTSCACDHLNHVYMKRNTLGWGKPEMITCSIKSMPS